jgi:hypothetical protein
MRNSNRKENSGNNSDDEELSDGEEDQTPNALDALGNDLIDPSTGYENRTMRITRQIQYLYLPTKAGRIVAKSLWTDKRQRGSKQR